MQMTSICQIYADAGLSAFTSGDLQTAEAMLVAGVKEAERQGMNSSASLALMQNLALIFYKQKRVAEAAALLEKALRQARKPPRSEKQSDIGLALADLKFELGALDQAQDLYRRYLLKAEMEPHLRRPRLKKFAYLLTEAKRFDLAQQVLSLLE